MLFTVTKIDVGSYRHICHKAIVQSTIVKRYLNNTVKLKQAISDKSLCIFPFLMYQSIPSMTIPRATPGDSHILVAPGVGFSLLCLARGSARGGEGSLIKVKVR